MAQAIIGLELNNLTFLRGILLLPPRAGITAIFIGQIGTKEWSICSMIRDLISSTERKSGLVPNYKKDYHELYFLRYTDLNSYARIQHYQQAK